VLNHLLLEVLSNLHTIIQSEAPMLLDRSPAGMTLATICYVTQTMETLGLDWMLRHGVQPLDLGEEQRRIARAALADPDLPDDIRESLEEIMAEDGELPGEVVMPSSGQVH
jgi:hypothetical protein